MPDTVALLMQNLGEDQVYRLATREHPTKVFFEKGGK
jgi:hypothetical protein